MTRKPRRTTPKQVLTREYNWKMGRLRNLAMQVQMLTWPRRQEAERVIYQEMAFLSARHKLSLHSLDGSIDHTTQEAHEAFRRAAIQNYEAERWQADNKDLKP